MYQAVKVRLYPTPEQKNYLAQAFGNCRWLWNYLLNATTTAYKETGKGLAKTAMDTLLPELKKEFDWLGISYSQCLQRVTFNLSNAFVNFFEGRSKFPNFKSKHSRQSIQYPQNVKLNLEQSSIKFPGSLGVVKSIFHRELPTGKMGVITVSRGLDAKYYASILFESPPCSVVAARGAVGVDLGLKDFAVTSNGDKYNLPKKHLKKLELNKKRKQQKLGRKQDGSKKKLKAQHLVAQASSKIAHVCEDFLHKLSRKIAHDNQVIVVENLAVKNMVKNPNIALAINNSSWELLQTLLKYKAQKFGHQYVEINRFFPSSQLCSKTLLPLPQLQKGYDSLVGFVDCPHCKQQHDRDINTAINIRNEGLRILALGTSAAAQGGDVRPQKRGRKKSTSSKAIPLELGNPHLPVGSSLSFHENIGVPKSFPYIRWQERKS